jgi:hypothetical protein
MSAFESELRACLGEVLGEEPPVPDLEALLFFKQWLAERNLGLVPIAEPAAFEWPGHWLARVRTNEEDHAVLMFGAPSGALFDPAGAMSDGGTICVAEPNSSPQIVTARSPGCWSLRRPRRRSSLARRSSQSRAGDWTATATPRAAGRSVGRVAATS